MKVLCVCALGMNRSRYAAHWLAEKGFDTRFGGIDNNALNPLKEEDVIWADIIIIARDRHQDLLKKKFILARKKPQYVLGVSDSPSMIPEAYAHLRELPGDQFHKQWTYPRLEDALEKLLPDLQKIDKT